MGTKSTKRIALIGEGNLTLACLEIIYNSQFFVSAVITGHTRTAKWCVDNQVCVINSDSDYYEILKTLTFDYLICIINENKVDQKTIQLANTCCINYHDSILPNYAGSHATGWALVNGEKKHGVTWHIMNDKIDNGDIILNSEFEISEYDDSFSLNLKCFEEAVESFKRLLNVLTYAKFSLISQFNGDRVFYYKKNKPINNGIVTKDMSLKQIQRLLKASFFGYIDNDFFSLKIQFGSCFYFILAAECFYSDHLEEPGTIVEINSSAITIAFDGGYLKLSKIADMTNIVNFNKLCCNLHLKKNMMIGSSSSLFLSKYKKHTEMLYNSEREFIKTIRKVSLIQLIDVINNNAPYDQSEYKVFQTDLNEYEFVGICLKIFSTYFNCSMLALPVETKNLIEQVLDPTLFLKYSFIYFDANEPLKSSNFSYYVKEQLDNLPLLQSDLTWRYAKLDQLIFSPQVLLSLIAKPSVSTPIVLNYYKGTVKILLANGFSITAKMLNLLDNVINATMTSTATSTILDTATKATRSTSRMA